MPVAGVWPSGPGEGDLLGAGVGGPPHVPPLQVGAEPPGVRQGRGEVHQAAARAAGGAGVAVDGEDQRGGGGGVGHDHDGGAPAEVGVGGHRVLWSGQRNFEKYSLVFKDNH